MSGPLDEGVGFCFPADGGFRSMTGIDGRFIRQGVDPLEDTVEQLIVVPSGQIGSTDAALEEDIATDEIPVGLAIEAQMGR